MGLHLRISKTTLAVLDALLANPSQWSYGYAISQRTEIASGTLYPILMRLEKMGWLETRWEEPRGAGRPPRHLYRLKPPARKPAREELERAKASKFWKPAYSEA